MDNLFGKFKDEAELMKGYENLEKEFTKKCQELGEVKRLLSEANSSDMLDKPGLSDSENNKTIVGEKGGVCERVKGKIEDGSGLELLAESALQGDEISEDEKFIMGKEEVGKSEESGKESAVQIKDEGCDSEFGVKFRSDVIKFLAANPDAKQYIKEISKILLTEKSLLKTKEPLKFAYLMAKGSKANEINKGSEKNREIGSASASLEEKAERKMREGNVYPRLLGGASANGFGSGSRKKYSSFEDARADLISRYFG